MKRSMLLVALILWIILLPAFSIAGTNPFAGTWKNIDPDTRGITSVEITVSGNTLNVRTWGRCHPTDCDWGTVEGEPAIGNRLKVFYRTNKIENTMWLTPSAKNSLKAEVRTHYADGSGRPDRTAIYQLRRHLQPAGPIGSLSPGQSASPQVAGQAGTPSVVGKGDKPAAGSITGPAGGPIKSAPGSGASSQEPDRSLRVLFPKGGEELVAGTDMEIKWNSDRKNNAVALILIVENSLLPQFNIPVILEKQARNTEFFRYRLPETYNSRYGYRYKVVVQSGGSKAASDRHFNIYPEVDLSPVDIQVRSKRPKANWKAWVTSVIKSVAVGGMTGTTVESIALDYKNFTVKPGSIIEVSFNLINQGIKILPQTFMTKVTVRLDPGNAELNSGGFTHKNIVPGRKYNYKATIDPKDWNMAPGVYRLEIAVDPQNNCHEPEALRANNVKTVRFRVQ